VCSLPTLPGLRNRRLGISSSVLATMSAFRFVAFYRGVNASERDARAAPEARHSPNAAG
jgi:hypothetical protein